MQMKHALTRGSGGSSGNLISSILLEALEAVVVGEDEAGAITRIAFNHFRTFWFELQIKMRINVSEWSEANETTLYTGSFS